MCAKDERVSPQKVELFGITFHDLTRSEALEAIERRIIDRLPGYVVTPNVDHLCRLQHDADFRDAYAGSFLSLVDGTPVLWASRLLGKPLREKVSGSDLVMWIAEAFAGKPYSLFLFGAAEGVAREAAQILQERYEGLTIAGTYSPPMGFEKDPKAREEALAKVKDAKPDICMVALGAPKQEFWMKDFSERSGVPVMMGIGASLDFVTGASRRAPKWMQKAGLEWAWRLCQEPRRLWRRYLVDDMQFVALVWREFWRGTGKSS